MSHHLMVLIHDFATVLWLGGMSVYVFVFLPLTQNILTKTKERKELMKRVITRLSKLMIFSMISISISGLILIPTTPEGMYLLFRWIDLYSALLLIKTVLSILMIALSLFKIYYIDKKIKNMNTRRKWIYRTIYKNIFLGVLVVTLSIVIRGYNTYY